jgi:hypothetical protein
MEYVWPARRHRNLAIENRAYSEKSAQKIEDDMSVPQPSRKSLDSSRALDKRRISFDSNGLAPPPLQRLRPSRSFTDLRNSGALSEVATTSRSTISHKSRAADVSRSTSNLLEAPDNLVKRKNEAAKQVQRRTIGDAAEMKTRSSQKTFILVKISR